MKMLIIFMSFTLIKPTYAKSLPTENVNRLFININSENYFSNDLKTVSFILTGYCFFNSFTQLSSSIF